MTPTTEPVTLLVQAQGARCHDCDVVFDITTCPYWSWIKSVVMHRAGTGHTVELFRLVAPA